MKLSKLLVAIALVVGLAVPTFAADSIAKLTFGDDQYLELHYLLQVQAYSLYKDGGTESDYWAKDFQIRRSRVIVKGQAAQGVEFFMETDAPKQEGGNSTNLFTQDAYIDFTIAKELKIAFGHILLPFMHHDRQSAVTLLCADYTAAVVPVGGNVWRDTGIEFRGLLANGLVDYRIGVFDGKDRDASVTPVINKNDMPRFTGRIQVNLKDAEEGFFYSGNYLGKKSIISFGAGLDYQQDVYNAGTKAKDYTAWTVDVYFDHPVAANNVLTLQGAYVDVKNTPFASVTVGGTPVYPEKMKMYFAEGGFLINGTWQPVARYYYKKVELSGVDGKISEVAGGLNYYIKGHNANIKVEYAQQLKDEIDDFKNKQVTIQCQIFI
ncbi:MAG: selenite/tellurite reduction operon porin ExtI [Spirochaetota bacterium]